MLARPDFAHHRERVLTRLADDEAVLCIGAPHPVRSGDSEYPYRPDSNLFWLSGWDQPECALLLRPGAEPFVMFVQPRDPTLETWTGRRPGPVGARERFGADAAWTIGELPTQLERLLEGVRVLHHDFGRDSDFDQVLHGVCAKLVKRGRTTGSWSPEVFVSPRALLSELRLLKSPDEVAVMRQAADISVQAQLAAMGATRPGVHEYQLEAVMQQVWRSAGSEGPGYTPIVAGGDNATILHYVRNRDVLNDGELVLVDAGCEVSFYTADITRTWPVGGRFSGPQRDLYAGVLAAQLAAIDQCRSGVRFDTIHDGTVRHLTEAMVAVGLLQGEVDDLIADESYKRYYMHGTSHWLGLDVHDVGTYARDGSVRTLTPGMVLTIEPGLYVPLDDTRAPEGLRGVGVRIEDDVLVTEGDPDVLTGHLAKAVGDVEHAVAS